MSSQAIACLACHGVWMAGEREQHKPDCPLPNDRLDIPLEERLAMWRDGKAEVEELSGP